MNDDAIVFAMANPNPEVMPEEAEPYVRIMATGRSDYPNQINNVLCFPGIFRGALDAGAPRITEEMKLAAAQGIADVVTEDDLDEAYIIPSVFDRDVAPAVAKAVVSRGAQRRDRAGLRGNRQLRDGSNEGSRHRRKRDDRLVGVRRAARAWRRGRGADPRTRSAPARPTRPCSGMPWNPTLERPPARGARRASTA